MRAAFDSGKQAALASFGLEKQANFIASMKNMPQTALNFAKAAPQNALNYIKSRPAAIQSAVTNPEWWKSQGRGAVQGMIGSPGEYAKQISEGRAFQPGGLIRESLRPKGVLDATMRYGLPALNLALLANAPSEVRGSAMGNLIGSTVGGVIGGPLGAVGQLGGQMLLGNLGSTIGSAFDSKRDAAQQPEEIDQGLPKYHTMTRRPGLGV